MSAYPIVEHRQLDPVAARFMRPRRRDLSELPSQPPGTVLVAVLDHDARVISRNDFSPTNDTIVNAASVAVVDVRPGRQVTLDIEVPSSVPGAPFLLRPAFVCQVTDAGAVVKSGTDDAASALTNHVRRDKRLMTLGREVEPAELSEFERRVSARVTAAYRRRPPEISGMSIELGHIEVVTPTELREHARAIANERRRQELRSLQASGSFEQAKAIEAVLKSGPEAIEALYLELGDERYARPAERAHARRDDMEARLGELITRLTERGHYDRVAMDVGELMNRYVAGLVGKTADQSPSIVLGSGVRGARQGLARGDRDEPDREAVERPADPPDEESLDD